MHVHADRPLRFSMCRQVGAFAPFHIEIKLLEQPQCCVN